MRFIPILFFMFVLSGCAAFEYGWHLQEYRERLVSTSEDDGQFRLNQIMNLNKSVNDLINNGFTPDYLYETASQDVWFIESNTRKYFVLENSDFFGGYVKNRQNLPSEIARLIIPEKVYLVQGNHNISIRGLERVYNLTSDVRDYYVIEVVNSDVRRLENTVENSRERVLKGSKREVNPVYYDRLRAYHSAQRSVQETSELKPIVGSNAAAFASGFANAALEQRALDNYYQRRMELASTPEFIDVPNYEYVSLQINKINFEKRVDYRLIEYKDGSEVSNRTLTYSEYFSFPENSDSIESMLRYVNSKEIKLSRN